MQKIFANRRYLSEWLWLIGGLLLVATIVSLTLYKEWVNIGSRERERLATQASVVKKNMGHTLAVVDRALIGIRDDLPDWQKKEGGMSLASHRLRAFADAMRSVRTMLVLDANGRVVAASRPELMGQNFSQRDYFRRPRANPDPNMLYVMPPFRTALGVWSMNVVRVIQDPKGQFLGIISATLDPDELRAQLSAVLYANDMWAAITHGDGLQVVMEPDQSGETGKNLAQPGTLFSRHMASAQVAQVFDDIVAATGEHRMVALHTIRPPDVLMDKALVVAVGRDMDTLYAHWYQQVWSEVGMLVFLMGLAVPVLAYAQSRRSRAEALKAQAEAALAKSEHFMRSLIDIIPGMVGYWTADLHSAFANRAYLEWFGKTPQQMEGIPMQELFSEELFVNNQSYIIGVLAGEHQSFERTLIKADGSTGYTWAHYIPDQINGQVQGFFVLVSDITDLKRSEIALKENRRFLKDLIEQSGTVIFAKDKAGNYLLINRMYEQITGHCRNEVLGRTDFDLYPHAEATALRRSDQAVMDSGTAQRHEEVVGSHYFLTTKFPLWDENGELNGICGISADITAQKKAQEEIQRLANTDMLTKLANRRHFLELAEIEISRVKRFKNPLSVLMLDIDKFKSVNDTYGHDVGDKVIASVGDLCRQWLREIDIAGRLGGEEFAVLLPDTPLELAQTVAERLRCQFENHSVLLSDGTVLKFTVSIGCVSSSDATLDIAELLKQADHKLYQAKQEGRNRVVV